MKRYLVFILFVIVLIPFIVYAETCDTSKITIESISIENRSDTVNELDDTTADNTDINLNLSLTEVGDNIEYRVVVKNDSNDDYKLNENTFNISSDYINYTFYSEDNSTILKANSSKTVFLKVEYANKVSDDKFENGVYNENKITAIQLSTDNTTNNTTDNTNKTDKTNKIGKLDILKNPKTGTLQIFLIIILLTSGITFLIVRNKRAKKIVSLVLITSAVAIPLSACALCTVDITINSNIVINKPIVCGSFENDSWTDISHNVKNNNTSCYHVGDTKSIDVGSLGTHTVRIANMSSPSQCEDDSFSQTACGFVVEFVDILFSRGFNSTTSNAGGWRDSEIRNVLNTETIELLPEDLRNGIIDTKVVSGHEKNVTDNYVTIDKLYLLSTSEVWLKCGTNDIAYDSADTLTRQLDYYESIGVTSTNYQGANKKERNTNSPWWLRTAHKNSDNYVGNVYYGQTNAYRGHASLVYGISPAFRF